MSPRPHLRVASVPASHVYVRHLSPPDPGASSVVRLPDPPSGDGEGWWPPAMLDAGWVHANRDRFDVFHVHFGFDARTTGDLAALVAALREEGKPLVHTAHDLRNPHHLDRGAHDAQLDVLVPAADRVVTLTSGAADEIRRRWGRDADVLPHPHVVDLPEMVARARRPAARRVGEFRVGMHVKSLRACMDPLAVLPALLDAVDEIPGGVLQVDGHVDVLDPDSPRHDRALDDALRLAGPRVDLRVHDYFTDRELFDYLESLDVSVLPYRFGTRSGWLEACRDLGTAVVAPSCGHYRDQGPVHEYVLDEERHDAASLTTAVLAAHAAGRPGPVPVVERLRERRDVAHRHAGIYAGLVA